MNLIDTPLRDVIQAFASPDPTPGGGSAAALAGAIGTSLLMMVCALPRTRSESEEDHRALTEALARLRPLRESLAALIDRDSEAYDAVGSAYRLPKGSDEEKDARKAAIQKALQAATEVPLQVMRLCAVAASCGIAVSQHGNLAAASDVGVGMALVDAGLRGARLNVEINLGSLRDPVYQAKIQEEAGTLADQADAAMRTFQK